MSKPLLSVITPAYKQEDSIADSIRRLDTALATLKYTYEIIVVVDGMDDKTYKNAKRMAKKNIRVVGYKTNRGKGYALRYGMIRSTGEIVAFIDAGKDLNPRGLQMLIAHFEWYDADIIVGSKWHRVSMVRYPWWRIVISRGYGLIVKILFGLEISDTQLGMKCYRRNVLDVVLPRLLVKRFAFDIELLAVAHRLGFTRIYEAPVELNWDSVESSVSRNLARSIFDTLKDTLAVYYRLKVRKFYDIGSKRVWEYDPELKLRVMTGGMKK